MNGTAISDVSSSPTGEKPAGEGFQKLFEEVFGRACTAECGLHQPSLMEEEESLMFGKEHLITLIHAEMIACCLGGMLAVCTADVIQDFELPAGFRKSNPEIIVFDVLDFRRSVKAANGDDGGSARHSGRRLDEVPRG